MEIHDLIKDIKVIWNSNSGYFLPNLLNERNNYFTNKVKYKLNSAIVVKKIIIDKKWVIHFKTDVGEKWYFRLFSIHSIYC